MIRSSTFTRSIVAVSCFLSTALVDSRSDAAPKLSLGETIGLPAWLTVRAHHQARIEYLAEQYRAGLAGDDTALVLRTGLFAEGRAGRVRLGGEIVDARSYLTDDNTPLSGAFANPIDILQAYVAIDFGDADADALSILLGRFTLDLGSRRFIARNKYRNTINGFTGVRATYRSANALHVDALAAVPIVRRPNERAGLADNDVVLDTENFDRKLWCINVEQQEVLDRASLTGFVFGRHDDTSAGRRNLYTPGLRFLLAPSKGEPHFELEAATQFGSVDDQTHLAYFVHVSGGYTFDVWATPRLTLLYEYASGDAEPNDARSGRFDRLYGVPRPEFGPTMLYAAFNRENIATPGVRLFARPIDVIDVIATLRSFALAEATDVWLGSGYHDPNGRSGRLLGHQIEVRARWRLLRGNVVVETGFTHLFRRGFAVTVTDGPAPNPTLVYLQLGLMFES